MYHTFNVCTILTMLYTELQYDVMYRIDINIYGVLQWYMYLTEKFWVVLTMTFIVLNSYAPYHNVMYRACWQCYVQHIKSYAAYYNVITLLIMLCTVLTMLCTALTTLCTVLKMLCTPLECYVPMLCTKLTCLRTQVQVHRHRTVYALELIEVFPKI